MKSSTDLISRKEAKLQGLSEYFTGEPCKHGHVAPRQTTNCSCVECAKTMTKNWRNSEAGKESSAKASKANYERAKHTESYKQSQKKSRKRYNNSEHGKAKNAEYFQSLSDDSKKNARLKSRYGITLEDYNQMLIEQNGCCLICNHSPSEPLHVDHCHTTLQVRGLLCANCNKGLGHFRDNVEFLRKAIDYLSVENQQTKQV